MQVTVPAGMSAGQPLQVQTPSGMMQVEIPAGCDAGATFEMLVPAPAAAAAPVPAPLPPPPPPAEPTSMAMPNLMSMPPPADAAPVPEMPPQQRVAYPEDDDGIPLPELMPLELDIDETKVKLPTFDEYKRTAPPKPVPRIGSFNAKTYQSKLPSINQGKSVYDDLPDKNEGSPLEKLVFRITIGGIVFLVFVEIFINTPLFQQLKPLLGAPSGN